MSQRRVVILDRDGTLIVERHYLSRPEEVQLLPGVASALRRLHQMGLALVVVTNQSGIGREMFDELRLHAIHRRLRELLHQEGVQLDGIYYCPHLPEDRCACRKPQPGLVHRAASELGFQPDQAFVIGDKLCDLELGRAIGAATVLVRTGYGKDVACMHGALADDVVDDLAQAADVIHRNVERLGLLPAEMVDVVVLCGGRGSRLGALTAMTPKSLLPIAGQPFLLHLLLRLKEEGFSRVWLAVCYLAEQFQDFLSTYHEWLPDVHLLVEPGPLGTGGAIRAVADVVPSSPVVILNGDSWLPQPLQPILEEHQRQERAYTVVGVHASQVEGGAVRKGVWRHTAGEDSWELVTPERATEGWVNAGIYVFDRAMVRTWPRGSYSLEERLASLVVGWRGGLFHSTARLLDIGTPACYEYAPRILRVPERTLMEVR